MEVFKINISSWTASFRYPNIISGVQPTLEVPPLSTVLGLMNAAAGKYIEHQQLKIGYFFEYTTKAKDLETIYQYKAREKVSKGVRSKVKDIYGNYQVDNIVKSNVILREFLFETRLSIYLEYEQLVDYFRQPSYQLVLGRSNDLATVEKIEKVELIQQATATKIRGQIIPFVSQQLLPGQIQALPVYFSNTLPRKNIGTQPYSIINHAATASSDRLETYRDNTNDTDIYFHQLKF